MCGSVCRVGWVCCGSCGGYRWATHSTPKVPPTHSQDNTTQHLDRHILTVLCVVCLGVGESVTRAVHTLACLAEGAYVALGGSGGKKKTKAYALDPTQAMAPLRLVSTHNTPPEETHRQAEGAARPHPLLVSLYCVVAACSEGVGGRTRAGRGRGTSTTGRQTATPPTHKCSEWPAASLPVAFVSGCRCARRVAVWPGVLWWCMSAWLWPGCSTSVRPPPPPPP